MLEKNVDFRQIAAVRHAYMRGGGKEVLPHSDFQHP